MGCSKAVKASKLPDGPKVPAGDLAFMENNVGYSREDFERVEAVVKISCDKAANEIANGNTKFSDPLADYKRVLVAVDRRIFDLQKCFMSHFEIIPIYRKLPTRYASITAVMNAASPSLTTLKVYRGFNATMAILVYILSDFVDLFQVAHKIPERHIERVAAIIMENYFYFTLAEIKYLLYDSLKENSMHRIDVNSITVLFEKYSIERQTSAAQSSLDDSNRQKDLDSLKRLKLTDEQAKMIKDYLDKATAKKVVTKPGTTSLDAEEKKIITKAIGSLKDRVDNADVYSKADPKTVRAAVLEADDLMKRGPISKKSSEELEEQYLRRQQYKRDQERLRLHNKKLGNIK